MHCNLRFPLNCNIFDVDTPSFLTNFSNKLLCFPVYILLFSWVGSVDGVNCHNLIVSWYKLVSVWLSMCSANYQNEAGTSLRFTYQVNDYLSSSFCICFLFNQRALHWRKSQCFVFYSYVKKKYMGKTIPILFLFFIF